MSDICKVLDDALSFVKIKEYNSDVKDKCTEKAKKILASYSLYKVVSSIRQDETFDMINQKLFEAELSELKLDQAFAKIDEYIRKKYTSSDFLMKLDECEENAYNTLKNDSTALDNIYSMIKNEYDSSNEYVEKILQKIRLYQIDLRSRIFDIKLKNGELPKDKIIDYMQSIHFKD